MNQWDKEFIPIRVLSRTFLGINIFVKEKELKGVRGRGLVIGGESCIFAV